MNLIDGLINAIDYVEENLDNEIELNEVAKAAACSQFYFLRIFGMLCGMPLGEYIRKRRLTEAAFELKTNPSAKVIDIALKYGYKSPESFSRSFLKFHGITPSMAKKEGPKLKSFSRFKVQISLKGGSVMDYKVVEKRAFKVVEKVKRFEHKEAGDKGKVAEFWGQSHKDGTVKKLLELSNDKKFLFGICRSKSPKGEKLYDYSIASPCDDGIEVLEPIRVTQIPARTWVIFEVKGAMPDAVIKTWHKVCSEFFPNKDYEPTYEMDIEAYTDGDVNSNDYTCQIWIPVIKKS